jgi:hypothetical protein
MIVSLSNDEKVCAPPIGFFMITFRSLRSRILVLRSNFTLFVFAYSDSLGFAVAYPPSYSNCATLVLIYSDSLSKLKKGLRPALIVLHRH